jgi:predicted XRE-type DNA-binding protein
MRDDDTSITIGSGNIFADLGLPNADDRLLKARIALAISNIIGDQHLSQSAAAERIGIAQPDVSRLLKGRLSGFSLERLLGFARALGSDIEIKIKRPHSDREGHMRLMVA